MEAGLRCHDCFLASWRRAVRPVESASGFLARTNRNPVGRACPVLIWVSPGRAAIAEPDQEVRRMIIDKLRELRDRQR